MNHCLTISHQNSARKGVQSFALSVTTMVCQTVDPTPLPTSPLPPMPTPLLRRRRTTSVAPLSWSQTSRIVGQVFIFFFLPSSFFFFLLLSSSFFFFLLLPSSSPSSSSSSSRFLATTSVVWLFVWRRMWCYSQQYIDRERCLAWHVSYLGYT